MVKSNYAKSCCPELKFLPEWGTWCDSKNGLSAWKNAPLFLNLQFSILTKPTTTFPHEMYAEEQRVLSNHTTCWTTGKQKDNRKRAKKGPRHSCSSCGIKSRSFPRAGNLPHLQRCRKESSWEGAKLQCGKQGQEEVLLCKGTATPQPETCVCDPWPCLGYSADTQRNKALEKSQNIWKFLGIGMRESKGNGSLFSLQEAEGRQWSNCQLWKLWKALKFLLANRCTLEKRGSVEVCNVNAGIAFPGRRINIWTILPGRSKDRGGKIKGINEIKRE